ncbi:YbdD/YjiX family protein [Sinomonas mesophila]|uniref:YbdD/YjiX family protein n=1 Tax=Sinomonas mesophila TaxID=1531955 RepID=UPI000984793C|nr:YbdD/YjiX family protein [Sinomonas mesophila]
MSLTSGGPDGGGRTTALAGVRSALAAVRAYLRGVMGADAYERYLEHHRAEEAAGRCAAPPLTEREFWRDRTDRQDTDPQGRCC